MVGVVSNTFCVILNENKIWLGLVADPVIQAIGRSEFEDGLRPGSPELILSDQRSVRTNL